METTEENKKIKAELRADVGLALDTAWESVLQGGPRRRPHELYSVLRRKEGLPGHADKQPYKELLETLQENTYTPIEWEGFTPDSVLPKRAPLNESK
jgi:hypothetical protein